MEVLVTGHAGYIGGVLAQQLSNDGHEVVGFDRAAKATDDIRDNEQVAAQFDENDFDFVYHLAAEADVWVDDWRYLLENNVMGTTNVVSAARDHDVPVVFASSVAASGNINRYGYSKHLAEKAMSEYDRLSIIRFPNVFGENAPRGQVQDMIEQGVKSDIEVWGNGELMRSYVDVSDLCSFLVKLGVGSFSVETPASVYSYTKNNLELGEVIQAVIGEETGQKPDLSVVARSPPSSRVLTGEDIRLHDATPFKESVRTQVRATISGPNSI